MSSRLRPTSAVACRARPVDRRPSPSSARSVAVPAVGPSGTAGSAVAGPVVRLSPTAPPRSSPRPGRRRRSPERRINPGPPVADPTLLRRTSICGQSHPPGGRCILRGRAFTRMRGSRHPFGATRADGGDAAWRPPARKLSRSRRRGRSRARPGHAPCRARRGPAGRTRCPTPRCPGCWTGRRTGRRR